jgi:hypothetical protein
MELFLPEFFTALAAIIVIDLVRQGTMQLSQPSPPETAPAPSAQRSSLRHIRCQRDEECDDRLVWTAARMISGEPFLEERLASHPFIMPLLYATAVGGLLWGGFSAKRRLVAVQLCKRLE